jgi:hypothetical protein
MSGVNDYLSTIMGTETDLDASIAAAGEVLVKVAEEEGVDIDDLSEDEVADLLGDIMGTEDGGVEDGGDYGGDMSEEKVSSAEVTHADVAQELAKIANAEGIDVNDMSRDEYHGLYNELANSMASGGYYEKVADAQEKLAEADAIGRAMAHSFDDELSKLAAGGRTLMGRLRSMGRRVKVKETRAAETLGRALRGGKSGERKRIMKRLAPMSGRAKDKVKPFRIAKREQQLAARKTGRVAGYGGAGVAATGAGAGIYATKRSFDEEATELARQTLLENGIDPDTGMKVASDYEGSVELAAAQILEDAGYTFE